MTRPPSNRAKSSKERDRAQETLSRFSQAASAIEPSDDGGIYGKSYKSKKSRNHDEEDTYRHYQQSQKNKRREGASGKSPRGKRRRQDFSDDEY